MTEPIVGREPAHADNHEISLLALASVVLRWRRTIVAMGLSGAVLGLAWGLLSPRIYVSDATFIPQGSEAGVSGLSLVKSQLGIVMPSTGATWGPPLYVELLRSTSLLEPIALDTVVVTEEGGRRVAIMDLLKVEGTTSERRAEATVRALKAIVRASEEKTIGAVRLSVSTRWPSVSLALAERLVHSVNQFNLQTRKSTAAAERQFVEVQAREAERGLREVEDRLQSFLQRNRNISGSPDLAFEHDRLQRAVALRQQVYTSLVQNREEVKIREVRDTPVITVLQGPRLPLLGEARKSAQKGFLGGLAGGILGLLIAFIAQGVAATRREPTNEAREFLALMADATPNFLRKRPL